MKQIGSKCFFEYDYEIDEDELYQVSKIVVSNKNLDLIIVPLEYNLSTMPYAILNDYNAENIYFYNKSDKSIKEFSYANFLKLYDFQIVRKHKSNVTFIGILLTYKDWIFLEDQAKTGINEKINDLYYHQCIEPYL